MVPSKESFILSTYSNLYVTTNNTLLKKKVIRKIWHYYFIIEILFILQHNIFISGKKTFSIHFFISIVYFVYCLIKFFER